MKATPLLLFLLLFLGYCRNNNQSSIFGKWQMHHMTHTKGSTGIDKNLNQKISSGKMVTTCSFGEDSNYEYIRNSHAPDEPVVRGSFRLNKDTVFIQDVFGHHYRRILKLTSDSLVLLSDEHVTTWYRVDNRN